MVLNINKLLLLDLSDKILLFPNKKLRAKVIVRVVKNSNYNNIVVLSCGNASRELKRLYKNTITPTPKKWLTQAEIAKKYPHYFDATSGHLPLWLMQTIAHEFKRYLGKLPKTTYIVPTGSGETILCLKMAYPNKNFIALYDFNRGSRFEPKAPLNDLIKKFFTILWMKKEKKY